MTAARIRVLHADDDARLRQVIGRFLGSHDDIKPIGTIESATDLRAAVQTLQPDIVLMDLGMAGRDPLQAMREIVDERPFPRFVVLSGSYHSTLVARAMSMGASAFLDKLGPPAELVETIRRVSQLRPRMLGERSECTGA